jgi:hypothetical protein
MRQAFAHEARLAMHPDADLRAPGAAVTVALCGSWDHEPPCPLAAHHTQADRAGDQVRLRMLFAAEPTAELTVRQRIDDALACGQLQGPGAVITRWRLLTSGPSELTAGEAAMRSA